MVLGQWEEKIRVTVLRNSRQIQPGDIFEEHVNEEPEVDLSYFQSMIIKWKLFLQVV